MVKLFDTVSIICLFDRESIYTFRQPIIANMYVLSDFATSIFDFFAALLTAICFSDSLIETILLLI